MIDELKVLTKSKPKDGQDALKSWGGWLNGWKNRNDQKPRTKPLKIKNDEGLCETNKYEELIFLHLIIDENDTQL